MRNLPDGKRLGLIFAILIPFIALGIQWVLWPYITPFVWFLFFPAVFFSARLGGLKGGLASTLLSTAIVCYFFIPPQLSWEVANPSNLYSVGLFLIMGYLISDSQEHLNAANRRTKETLREIEEHNRTTLYSIGDCVITTDTGGRVWQMNPAAEKTTGWRETQAKGKPIGDVFRIVNEDTRREVEDPVARVMREGMVVGLANHTLLIARDGPEYPIADSGAPIRNLQGEITGVVLVFRDQTAERAAENALRESERKFRETITYLDEGYYSCMMDGVLLDHNRAFNRMLGFETSQDLRGTKLPDFWQNPDDRKGYLSQLMTEGVVRNFLINAKIIDGAKIVVMANAHLVKDEMGKPVRIEGAFTDITERKNMEDALKESEAKYRALFENAQVGIYRTKLDGSAFLDVNDKFAEIMGFSRQELLGSPGRIRWANPENRDKMLKQLQEQGGILANYEVQVITKNGEVKDVLASIVLFPGEGTIEGTMTDITERKRAEQALRQSETTVLAWLNAIQESAFLMDREGIILAANATVAQRLHQSVEELVGACIYDFIPPQTAHARRLHVAQVIEAGQPVRFEDERFGRVFDNLIYPVFDQSGQVKHMAILGTDITERKQAEEEIRKLNTELEQRVLERTAQLQTTNTQLESELAERKRAEEALQEIEERFRRLSDAAFEAIIIHDGGLLLSANNQYSEMFGYEPEELLGKQVMPLTIAPDAIEAVKKEIATGGVGPYESTGQRKDGTRFPMEIRVREIEYIGRKVRVAAIMDITERKRAEEALRQRSAQLEVANQELETFAYSVSHDLRAPLRAMDGFSAALLTSYPDKLDEQGRHYLDRIRNASQRMGQLIEDLLGLSRVTRSTLNRQQVDLSVLAQEVASEVQKRDPQRQADFIIAPQMTAEADPHLLRILLQNLLDNAWKFTSKREATLIEVGCMTIADFRSRNADWATHLPQSAFSNLQSAIYFVRDNGVGFDMAYADKLFAPFQRLHSMQEFPGTGIGLAIVQRIVARHGGRAWAEAQVDKGSTFYFALGGL